MAGSIADYAENKVLELLVGKTAFTTPSVWVALFTAAPSDTGGGTEATGGSYARKSTAGADWAAASGGSITNANDITFVTATGTWGGAITHCALIDSSTSGGSNNYIAWADLAASKTVASGDVFKFLAGALVFTLS